LINCQCCGSKAQLYLCGTCLRKLGEMITNLADGLPLGVPSEAPPERDGDRSIPLLEALQDAAWGRTRLGQSARRSSENSRPAPCRLTNHPTDSFAGSPSELLDQAHATLEKWVETIRATTQTVAKEEL
jgi:hypothetical protein